MADKGSLLHRSGVSVCVGGDGEGGGVSRNWLWVKSMTVGQGRVHNITSYVIIMF